MAQNYIAEIAETLGVTEGYSDIEKISNALKNGSGGGSGGGSSDLTIAVVQHVDGEDYSPLGDPTCDHTWDDIATAVLNKQRIFINFYAYEDSKLVNQLVGYGHPYYKAADDITTPIDLASINAVYFCLIHYCEQSDSKPSGYNVVLNAPAPATPTKMDIYITYFD